MENKFSMFLATTGTVTAAFLGGWDNPLIILLTMMALNVFLVGWVNVKHKNFTVSGLLEEVGRKVLTLGIIALCYQLDMAIHNVPPLFRAWAVYFYIGFEYKLLEKCAAALDFSIPAFLANVTKTLETKLPKSKKE